MQAEVVVVADLPALIFELNTVASTAPPEFVAHRHRQCLTMLVMLRPGLIEGSAGTER